MPSFVDVSQNSLLHLKQMWLCLFFIAFLYMSIRSKQVIFVMEALVSRQYTENIPKSNVSQQCNLPVS